MPYIKWNEARTGYEIWYGPGIGSAAMAEKGYEKVDALPEIPVEEAPLSDLCSANTKLHRSSWNSDCGTPSRAGFPKNRRISCILHRTSV